MATTRTAPWRITEIPRALFLARYWDYQPGEHVTIIGKTGSGKTYLGFQLLNHAISKQLPGVVLVAKPRDATVDRWQKTLQLRRVKSWPPAKVRNMVDAPRGWLLWPQLGDLEHDDQTLRTEFQRCFRESYAQAARRNGQPRALFADEVVHIAKDLKLEQDLSRLWRMGRSVGIGLWALTQRPYNAPLLAYQAAEHLFLAREPDQRNRERLQQIGGFDSAVIERIVDPNSGLLTGHQFLYLQPTRGTMAIIGD